RHGSGGAGSGARGPARPRARDVTVRRPAAYAIGVAAALSVPLWLRGGTSRLADLIRAPGPLGRRGGDPADALRAAHRTLRVLARTRSGEHTSELQSPCNLVCRLLLEKKKHYPKTGTSPIS